MKRALVLLTLLGGQVLALAVPAGAFPPQCTCGYCTLNPGTTNCTIVSPSGNTVVTCGYYYPRYCTGPA